MKSAFPLFALVLPVLAFPATVRRFCYTGSDPAAWTRTVLDAPAGDASAAGYTTYIGDGNDFHVAAIATGVDGSTYLAGSRSFPTSSGGTLYDVFVAKLDATGAPLFTATFSGKGSDAATALALDREGNIYLAGSTTSTNFPLRQPLLAQPAGGFLVKLSPDASRIVYSTYFWDSVAAIAVDADENVYLTGTTTNPGFPHTTGLPADPVRMSGPPTVSGAFFSKVSAGGDRLLYSGVLAGAAINCSGGSSCLFASRSTRGVAIAVSAGGEAYVLGGTNTIDLPATPNALNRTGVGTFVLKVNTSGSGLAFLTYLGPRTMQFFEVGSTPAAMALDAAGNVVLLSYSANADMPVTPGAYQPILARGNTGPQYDDVYAAKLTPDGATLIWATFLGGTGEDEPRSLALDSAGNLWIAGTTQSPDFPNPNGWSQGGDFLAELNASGTALLHSARFPSSVSAQAVALDSSGSIHLAGPTGIVAALTPDLSFHTQVWGVANLAYGLPAGLVAPGELISIIGPLIGPANPVAATVGSDGRLPKSLGGVQVLFDDALAPLLFASATEVRAVVPFGMNGRTSARLRLISNNVASPDFAVAVVPALPEIFRTGGGYAAALNEDGTLNSPEHPAKVNSEVAIWATGTGFSDAEDGVISTGVLFESCCSLVAPYTPIELLYVGAAPGLVAGMTQINFRVPAQLSTGFQLLAGGRRSEFASIYVEPMRTIPIRSAQNP